MSSTRQTRAPAHSSESSGLTGTISIGHVNGVPVRAHWSVLVIMALLWWLLSGSELPDAYPGRPEWQYVLVGGIAAAVFLLGLLAHEGAHAVAARHNDVQVGSVTLWMLGGFTDLKSEARTPGAELRIAGAGPLASLVLGVAFGALAAIGHAAGWATIVVGTLKWLAAINVVLAVFNVLPGAPLDGGRLLRATLWRWRGDRTWATIAAARCGRALGIALVVLGAIEFFRYQGNVSGLWLALIGWFVMGSARNEEQQARLGQALTGVRVGDVMTPSPETAPPDLTVAQFLDNRLWAYRHATVPLAEVERPVGLVTVDRLRAVPADARDTTPLGQLARPMSEVPVATPDDALIDLVPRINQSADRRALVTDNGRLVGIVSPSDISRAVEHGQLRHPDPVGTRG